MKKGIKKVLLENKSEFIKKEVEGTTRALMIKTTLTGNKPGELHDDMTFVGFVKTVSLINLTSSFSTDISFKVRYPLDKNCDICSRNLLLK